VEKKGARERAQHKEKAHVQQCWEKETRTQLLLGNWQKRKSIYEGGSAGASLKKWSSKIMRENMGRIQHRGRARRKSKILTSKSGDGSQWGPKVNPNGRVQGGQNDTRDIRKEKGEKFSNIGSKSHTKLKEAPESMRRLTWQYIATKK